jgi:hypothetical protein
VSQQAVYLEAVQGTAAFRGKRKKKEKEGLDYCKILTAFYMRHQPSKLRELDEILEVWQEQEEKMTEALKEKYPRFSLELPEDWTAGGELCLLDQHVQRRRERRSSRQAPAPELPTEEAEAILTQLYSRCNKTKLAEGMLLGALFAKYEDALLGGGGGHDGV